MTTHHSSLNFAKKLTLYCALIVVCSIATLVAPWGLKLVPISLLGIMFAHGIELEHELIHQKHFSHQWRQMFGFLLGLPMLVEFSRYTITHGYHHRMVGTKDDEESFGYDFNQLSSPLPFLLHISMLAHYQQALQNVFYAVTGQHSLIKQGLGKPGATVSERLFNQVVRGYFGFAMVLAIAGVLSFVLPTTAFLQLWLLPLFIASPVHALIELPEHWGCRSNTTNCLENTRTIVAGKFATWLTNGNCWHVEHHHNPAVSIDDLANLHRQLAADIQFLNLGYRSFYAEFFGAMVQKGRSKEMA